MGDLILSVRRGAEEQVLSDLRERGPRLGWEYRRSLNSQLADFVSGGALRDFAYTFHRVSVEDGVEIPALVRMQLLYGPGRTGRFEAEPNDVLTYAPIGLPFQLGGQHQNYLAAMNVDAAHRIGVKGQNVR